MKVQDVMAPGSISSGHPPSSSSTPSSDPSVDFATSSTSPPFAYNHSKGDKSKNLVFGPGGVLKEGPVKAACLSCRSKKAKCDGAKPVCTTCRKKGLDCEYVKSRRGGPRKRRPPPPSALKQFLERLDGFWSIPDHGLEPGEAQSSDDPTNIVRSFSSREEIFQCYYNEVHPFLPMMPPRKYLQTILPTLLTQSPFILACSTILVLVPHPKDPRSASDNSKRLRSSASYRLAGETQAIVNQLISAGQANIECIQALAMLSLWAWGAGMDCHGSMKLSADAVHLAMNLGVHQLDSHPVNGIGNGHVNGETFDWHKDMIRRTWWTAYTNQLTTSIVTGTTPASPHDDPNIQIDFPTCSLDDQSWSRWSNTVRECAKILEIVNTVYFANPVETGSWTWGATVKVEDEEGRNQLQQQIRNVDAQVLDMMRRAEAGAIIDLVPGGEEEVVRNQQLSARLALSVLHIHIHRHQAFPEVSLFSKMICGIPQMPSAQVEFQDASPTDLPSAVSSIPMSTFESSMSKTCTATGDGYDEAQRPLSNGSEEVYDGDPLEFVNDMWQPETYPSNLPEPWFAHLGGAGNLYAPVQEPPVFYPEMTASIVPIATSPRSLPPTDDGRRRSISAGASVTSSKPHKAWGVDENDKPIQSEDSGVANVFPPGVSLARCATAAHAVVRLEVLHRSATIAMWDGPPKWMPFCACGLVSGAYAFLLLALAVQAENAYQRPTDEALEQVEGLLTNVKVIVAGLEAYGVIWDGIALMAREVRAALEAATRLPAEMRAQLGQSYAGLVQDGPTSGPGTNDPQDLATDDKQLWQDYGYNEQYHAI